jgi:hypothetical protein
MKGGNTLREWKELMILLQRYIRMGAWLTRSASADFA